MENSFVLFSCVWCGVAFLRGLGGTLPTQMRDYRCLVENYLVQEKRREVRFLSLAPKKHLTFCSTGFGPKSGPLW
jgi:hypothetical protein